MPVYSKLVALPAPTTLASSWSASTGKLKAYTSLYSTDQAMLISGSETKLLRDNEKRYHLFQPLFVAAVSAGFAATDPCPLYFGSIHHARGVAVGSETLSRG